MGGRALALLGVLLAAPAQSAARASIHIDADQQATVSADVPSLKALVEDLCIRAGIELLAYDAPDRPVRINYRSIPLYELLPKLLKKESHLMRLGTIGGRVRVVRLRVMGDEGVAIAARASGKQGVSSRTHSRLWVSPSLMEAAFGAEAYEERQAALSVIEGYLRSDASRYRQFMDADPGWMAGILRRYTHSAAMLGELRSRQKEAEVARKLDAVLAALAQPPDPASIPRPTTFNRTSP